MEYVITVDKIAFASMLMNSLETFLLPMGNTSKRKNCEVAKGHEIFGYIFGSMKVDKSRDRCDYHVQLINFDATSQTSQASVIYNTKSKDIKSAISQILYPKMKLLGTIHTHPYRLLKEEEDT